MPNRETNPLREHADGPPVESNAREAALREILESISANRGDETPVFDVILTHARALCKAPMAVMILGQEGGDRQAIVADHGAEDAALRFFREGRATMDPEKSFSARVIINATPMHIADLADTDGYRAGNPTTTTMVNEQGIKSVLLVPLIAKGQGIGVLALFRQEVRPFTDSQIALVETFAEQAVIAIENVRQYRELQTRLEREEASREILQVISQSRADTAPVFEVILRNAARLCGAAYADLDIVDEDGTHLREVATWGPVERSIPAENCVWRMDSDYSHVVATREGGVVHVPDLTKTERYLSGDPMTVAAVDVEKMRTCLMVPLLKERQGIGCLVLFRQEQNPFSPDEITLVETFAEQALIAIENVRQFRELQTRLAREAATSDVLRVINQSRTDSQPVFQAIHDNVSRLCDAPFSGLFLLDEAAEELEIVSHRGGNADYVADAKRAWPLADEAAQCRAVLRKEVIHVRDLTDTKAYRAGHEATVRAVEVEGIRTFLAVPLMKGGRAIGSIGTYRCELRPFSVGEVELLQTFAAQAVIAIENVKQFNALEQLNAELGDRVQAQVGELERVGRLKRFLPSAVADTVMSSGSEGMLESHRAMLGVLFCDIRGFTAFCETAEPEETIEVLQTYHEEMGKLINAHGAGVDLKMGDGIMVLFNDPIPCDDPAGSALRMAIEMRERMVDLCAKWRKLGHRMGFGVGISLGYATVGMVGFEGRYDYTASGSAVNLASRLCDQAVDQEILLSQRAATALEDIAEVVSAGELTLKGFHAPVDVYRLERLKDVQ